MGRITYFFGVNSGIFFSKLFSCSVWTNCHLALIDYLFCNDSNVLSIWLPASLSPFRNAELRYNTILNSNFRVGIIFRAVVEEKLKEIVKIGKKSIEIWKIDNKIDARSKISVHVFSSNLPLVKKSVEYCRTKPSFFQCIPATIVCAMGHLYSPARVLKCYTSDLARCVTSECDDHKQLTQQQLPAEPPVTGKFLNPTSQFFLMSLCIEKQRAKSQ